MKTRRDFLKCTGHLALGLMAAPLTKALGGTQVPSDITIRDIKALRFQQGSDKALYVRIETSDGTVGWGESSPNGITVIQSLIEDILKPQILGMDPFNTEYLWEQMFWQNHDLGSGGALTYAIAGVDCALWDIKGKILGKPVYELIGGKFRDRVPAYGGFGISGGKVPVKQAIARALKLAEEGFKTIKIRAQIREYNINPADDPSIKYYQAIRRELPEQVDLFLDPNEGYTAHRAIQVGKQLQDQGMKYFEAPCPNEVPRETAQVVEALDIPVMTGEKCYNRWMFRDLIRVGNPDMLNPDFIKSGGITEGLKICHLAQAHLKEIVPHNTKPMLGSATTMHIIASIPNCGPLVEYIEVDRFPQVCDIFDQGIKFEEGQMLLPEGHGLGLTINESRAKKLFNY